MEFCKFFKDVLSDPEDIVCQKSKFFDKELAEI
jgi:hypothetical protein